jgi:hypothetical protein
MRPQAAVTDRLEEAIFWTSERVRVERPLVPPVVVVQEPDDDDEAGQFVIEDEDDEDAGTATPKKATPAPVAVEEDEWEELPPLAERLLAALVDLAFVPGFTVPAERRTADGAVAYVIWFVVLVQSPVSSPV